MNASHVFSRRVMVGLVLAVLVCAAPQVAMGNLIRWEPPFVDFGPVPIGGTGVQILTLTNVDPTLPLNIQQIFFTFNQAGAFAWSASPTPPALLLPDEKMIVTFTFEPLDISFHMAEVYVNNTSENASPLYIQLLGEGTSADPCDPMTTCGEECVDIWTDIDHCGGCWSPCAVPENGTAVCEVGTCGFVCDPGYEPVGPECVLIGAEPDIEEMMADIIAFFDESRADGSLVGFGAGASAEHRADALGNMLDDAAEHIAAEEWNQACAQLNSARKRTDTGWFFPPPPDFVAGANHGLLYEMIMELIEEIWDETGEVQCFYALTY